MSVDAQRIQEFINRVFFGVTIPAILLGVIVIMYFYVYDAAFAGVVVLLVIVPVASKSVKSFSTFDSLQNPNPYLPNFS